MAKKRNSSALNRGKTQNQRAETTSRGAVRKLVKGAHVPTKPGQNKRV